MEQRSKLKAVPMTIKRAIPFVRRWHRHLTKVKGGLFALAVARVEDDQICGVAIVARPDARMLDNTGEYAEIIRIATDGTPNACSKLIGMARRIAGIMGYVNITTCTLPQEGGASLRGAGLKDPAPTAVGNWNRGGRPREPGPLDNEPKWRWTQKMNVR